MIFENKSFRILLIILNSIVLLGQLWPAGAPPFAVYVNIITLILNLALLIFMLKKK
jgi:hypothetical protein